METAKVTPIYKGQGSKGNKKNYRPISVLPLQSKILEKHVHEALYSYIKKTTCCAPWFPKILLDGDSAHSSDAGSVVISCYVDKDQVSGHVFVDYKKAFDLIGHDQYTPVQARSIRYNI